MVLLLIVVGVMLAVAVGTALVFFILFLVKQRGGTTDEWRRLVEVYATEKPPAGQTVKVQALQIGAVTYKRCATLGIASEGLYVTIWQKTALIPWTEFKGVGEATLSWQEMSLLTIGDPPVATMAVPVAVFQLLRGELPTALTGA
jgi:hypothetical protein